MNAVLIGFMGCGKTTVGRIVSQYLKWNFIDTDDLIVEKTKISISDIFKRYGEAYFRQLESQIIKDISDVDRCIISLGGGAVLNEQNINTLKGKGLVFYLKGSPETIIAHIGDNKDRPLLHTSNPYNTIKELLNKRHPLYVKNSHYSIDIDGKDPETIAHEIINILKGAERRK